MSGAGASWIMLKELFTFLSDQSDLVIGITAIAAVLISVFSLIVTVSSIYFQNRHNRISVMPIGFISISDYEDFSKVQLCNYGVGPMMIKRLTVMKIGSIEVLESALINCVTDLPDHYVWRDFVENIDGRVVPANGQIVLLHYQVTESDLVSEKIRDQIRKDLAELSITVEYTDVYGRKMVNAYRSLKWFGRNL
jgi:hypothetical protein